jgi:hypothetical protein
MVSANFGFVVEPDSQAPTNPFSHEYLMANATSGLSFATDLGKKFFGFFRIRA